MRRFLYKNEINYIFLQHNVEEAKQDAIVTELFEEPFGNDSKQYLLKDEHSSVSELDQALDSKSDNANLKGAIKSLFIVSDDLHLPPDLKSKIINNEPVAVFIGAGVSKILDYPLWSELANNAIDFLKSEGLINHFEYDKINNGIGDPKQKLSIFDKFCPRTTSRGQRFYKEALKEKEIGSDVNPYDLLVSPYFNWVKMTSNVDYALCRANYDRHTKELEENGDEVPGWEEFKEQSIVTQNFSKIGISANKTYYLHGELDYIADTIFTTEDYIKNYFQNSGLRKFLRNIFKDYTVVFIGYGLEEFPILEAVMEGTSKRHYALMPTYLNEMNIVRIKEQYYNQLNISLLPYYKDFNGYQRLYSVLEHWEEDIIREAGKDYYDNLDEIDEAL